MYAFPWPHIETFLLGGDEFVNPKLQKKGQTLRIRYVKDKEGNPITQDHPDFDKHAASDKNWSMPSAYKDAPEGEEDWKGDPVEKIPTNWVLYNNANRKKFKYDGELWHHLGNWLKPFEVINRRGSWTKSTVEAFKRALQKEMMLNKKSKMSGTGGFTKDHLEVFIERV
jgi:hypothetical protein